MQFRSRNIWYGSTYFCLLVGYLIAFNHMHCARLMIVPHDKWSNAHIFESATIFWQNFFILAGKRYISARFKKRILFIKVCSLFFFYRSFDLWLGKLFTRKYFQLDSMWFLIDDFFFLVFVIAMIKIYLDWCCNVQ